MKKIILLIFVVFLCVFASACSASLELEFSTLTLDIGDSITLYPITKHTKNEAIFASSDDNVATVDEQGLVAAVGKGEANITVTVGDLSAVCVVKVTDPYDRYMIAESYNDLVVLVSGSDENIIIRNDIAIYGTIVIPEHMTVWIEGDITLDIGRYTLINNGEIFVKSDKTLTILLADDGIFENNGKKVGGGEIIPIGSISGDYDWLIADLISMGCKTVNISADITLYEDICVPSDVTLNFLKHSTIKLGGYKFANEGEIHSDFSMMISGEGEFVNDGTVTGSGTIYLSSAVSGDGKIEKTATYAMNFLALSSLIVHGCDSISLVNDILFTGDIAIGQSVTIRVLASLTLDIATFELENNGSIVVLDGYTLTLNCVNGDFVDNGDTHGQIVVNRQ